MAVPEHSVYYLEIVTPDARATSELYAEAYGWSFENAGPEMGNSLLAALPDGSLCGIRAPMHEMEKPIVRPYLRVIDIETGSAAPEVQWTMNSSLAEIGIHCPKHRKRALAIGEDTGIYRDYPVSKGCTLPFAPIWIHEMVKRQG